MSEKVSRRGFLKYAAVGGVALAGAAAGAYYLTRPPEKPPEIPPEELEATLSVFEWTGYELEEFWAPFKQKYPKVKVEFSFFVDESEAFSKLQAGFKPDVVHPCGGSIKRWVDAGVIQPIDISLIPNYKDIYPQLLDAAQEDLIINDQHYLVPWDWGYSSITYRPDLLEAMGVEAPDSYNILWDTRLKGRVSAMDSAIEIVPMAALAAGIPRDEVWEMTDEQMEIVRQKLLELKANARAFWTDYTEVFQMMATDEVVAAETWNDILVMLRDEGLPAEFLDPKEGRLAWVCGFSIIPGIDELHYKLAHEYINAALAPESMTELVNTWGYGASNQKAAEIANQDNVSLLELDKPEKLTEAVFWKFTPREERWVEIWAEVKAA